VVHNAYGQGVNPGIFWASCLTYPDRIWENNTCPSAGWEDFGVDLATNSVTKYYPLPKFSPFDANIWQQKPSWTGEDFYTSTTTPDPGSCSELNCVGIYSAVVGELYCCPECCSH